MAGPAVLESHKEIRTKDKDIKGRETPNLQRKGGWAVRFNIIISARIVAMYLSQNH
jgi:hypothetical protein